MLARETKRQNLLRMIAVSWVVLEMIGTLRIRGQWGSSILCLRGLVLSEGILIIELITSLLIPIISTTLNPRPLPP